jgi:hypothetical protein
LLSFGLLCLPETGGIDPATEKSFMTKSIGAALLTLGLMFGGSAAIDPAAAAPSHAAAQKAETWKATDLGARRRSRHRTRYASRPYDRPYYYERPYYYAPAPFVPFNFGYDLWPW